MIRTAQRQTQTRAQIEGTIIIYVLAVFIGSLVLLFGYSVIKEILASQRSIELLDFKQDLRNELKQKLSEFQSRDTLSLTLPSNFEQLCFVSAGSEIEAAATAETAGYPLVSYLLGQTPATPHNVFLLENGVLHDLVDVGRLALYEGSTPRDLACFEVVAGRVDLVFIARGREGVNIAAAE